MLLIKNGLVKTMVGEDIENGSVLIGNDGKIAAVGKDIKADNDTEVIDAGGRLVTPGCVEAHCHIGVHGSCLRWEGFDVNDSIEPITPHLRGLDSIDPMDEAFDEAIKYGVTSALTGPGSANVIGGTFAAIKLYGNRIDNMIIKNPVAMKCAFGENPKENPAGKGPKTRMSTAAMLREMLFKTKRYLEDKEAGKNPAFDMKLEALIPVIKKEIPLKAHMHRCDDIFSAIRIAKEFDVNLTLDHCTAGGLIADELAKEGYPIFYGPILNPKSKVEVKDKSLKTPALLHSKGLKVSISTDAPVTPLHFLPMSCGVVVSEGLPYEEGWRAITINPAESTGIGDRVGSLEVGKDADVVIWEKDPLKLIGAKAYITIIDGKIVYKA